MEQGGTIRGLEGVVKPAAEADGEQSGGGATDDGEDEAPDAAAADVSAAGA